MKNKNKKPGKTADNVDDKLLLSDSNSLQVKPFYMTSRSGNKVDYNPFGYNEYKQYDI